MFDIRDHIPYSEISFIPSLGLLLTARFYYPTACLHFGSIPYTFQPILCYQNDQTVNRHLYAYYPSTMEVAIINT